MYERDESPKQDPRARLATWLRFLRGMRSFEDRVTTVYCTYCCITFALNARLQEHSECRSLRDLVALLDRSHPTFTGKTDLMQRLRDLEAWIEHGAMELAAGRLEELNIQSKPYVRDSLNLLRRVHHIPQVETTTAPAAR